MDGYTRKQIELPNKLLYLLKPDPERYFEVLHGGRGAGPKSTTVAKVILIRAATERQQNGRPHKIFCCREIQNSIGDSVLATLKEECERIGLADRFPILMRTKSDRSFTDKNGTQFLFEGLFRNTSALKSVPGTSMCWIEEAATISKQSWDDLIPTVARTPGAIFYVTFNPINKTDLVSQEFLENEHKNARVTRCFFEDSPFHTQAMRDLRDRAYYVDPDGAAHLWGGEYRRNSAAQIFGPVVQADGTKRARYSVEEFEPTSDWHGPYYGQDYGFSGGSDEEGKKNPSAAASAEVKCWLSPDKKTGYIEYEAGGYGLEQIDDQGAERSLGKTFEGIPGALYRHQHKLGMCRVSKDGICQFGLREGSVLGYEWQPIIRGDCASPTSINYLTRWGFNVAPCSKYAGSVEDGIRWLKGLEKIVIHKRCVNAADEFRMYSHKVDKAGNVLVDIVDAWNHYIDAIRYAFEPEWQIPEVEGVVVYDGLEHHGGIDAEFEGGMGEGVTW